MVQEEYTIKPAEMPVFSIILRNSFIRQPDSFKNSIKNIHGFGLSPFSGRSHIRIPENRNSPNPVGFRLFHAALCRELPVIFQPFRGTVGIAGRTDGADIFIKLNLGMMGRCQSPVILKPGRQIHEGTGNPFSNGREIF